MSDLVALQESAEFLRTVKAATGQDDAQFSLASVRLQRAAARITALETALAEAEGRVKEARRQALEEAAKACEAHMSQCLDDRDIQKRWSQIKARNAVYAQAIRALASDGVKK